MYIELKEERTYRGKKHSKGTVLEVDNDLGARLLAIGVAKLSTHEAYQTLPSSPIDKKSLNVMNKKELIAEAETLGLSISNGMTNAAIRDIIKAASEA